ncbi:M14 family metallopeptidase [Herminiimonas fonticola]|uniref:Murein tripeptide amidase MpaA n=1 Tax=Herminiimonas fonticola TaxID=303380 RepID=A0A4R6G1S6_9BURK|nr:M14-type cytosolic carboxypeptidase [Herminiimonas fonticola]RBA23414.1 putative carboxypeptidase [Herminiimonas fonticola]TDN88331.1 murein tripeptide amidase MpaA [Herminiimonas fonticola]
MSIKISSHFDAGAIDIVRAETAQTIELKLRKDTHADIAQWFYFRLQGARGERCTMRFLNAGEATYPDGWKDYQAVASYDRKNWFRVSTVFDGSVMTISHTPQFDSVYYAYFEPYSWERHLDLLGRAQASSLAHTEDLGSTVEGRDLNVLVIGDPAARKKVWVIARQHPGEAMAEWFAEGMVDALLDTANPVAQKLLKHTVFYIVPNMNPDGALNGNLRTNAAGANLNREWMAPTLESSPEVFHVKNKIHETGCDLFLDIHGDEGLPYVFVAGSEMLEGFTQQQADEQQAFITQFLRASEDFQTEVGYDSGKYRADMLKLASKYIGHTFKCVSLTLEMPFKDNAHSPDPKVGWNGARSAQLGRQMLQPILHNVERGAR